MRNKSSRRYSYNNHDSRGSKFINKNFNKTNSYHTNFSSVVFQNTSFIGAKFKFCSLYKASFENCFIRGTLFKKCNLKGAIFKNSIISSSIFERCKLEGCEFRDCKIVTSGKIEKYLPQKSFINTEVFDSYPSTDLFNKELIDTIEMLRLNDFIRRSRVLHRKNKKLDTVSIKFLVEKFGEDFLLENLPKLPKVINKDFYSLSYIEYFLHSAH